MYESPLTLNEWKIEANSLDQAIKDTAESVGEKFDRYVLHVISETGITVDRDELIKALRYDRDQYTKGYHEGMERGIEISSPTWIPVTERLPELDQEVLVYAVGKIDGFIGDSVYALTERFLFKFFPSSEGTEEWRSPWQYFMTDYEITHWMPLPEPPRDGGNNG